MQYQALYRKYRPHRFDEVVGQDHITETLAREVVEDKIAHAYLFTGPHGTGKTTSARLLAMALNCTNRADNGEPCNECVSCEGITNGSSIDVVELDAASHNKVEDIREIRVNVSTVAAADGARRIYILDEAHMLSRAASNALLKTLEEPPEHVVFVLATTEPYKLLDTIRSRTQRFDFRPVASEILIEHLAGIADKEGFSYDHEALGAVTVHAEGSVRDALSLLEQVAALGSGEVTTAGVSRALGVAASDSYGRLLDLVVAGDAAGGMMLVAELASQGADIRRFVSDAIGYLRGVFLAQYAPNIEEVVDAPNETIEEWRIRAASISSSEVLRTIDELSNALAQLRDGREERLVLELAILRLTRPEVIPDLESVTVRLDRVERSVRDLARGTQNAVASNTASTATTAVTTKSSTTASPSEGPVSTELVPSQDKGTVQPSEREPAAKTKEEIPTGSSVAEETETATTAPDNLTLQEFERIWPAIVAQIRQDLGPRRHALLKEAAPAAVADGLVTFEVAAHMHFHLEQMRADDGISEAIAAAAADQLGQSIKVEFRAADAPPDNQDSVLEVVPDKDELVEAGTQDQTDAVANVLDVLGGEIVND